MEKIEKTGFYNRAEEHLKEFLPKAYKESGKLEGYIDSVQNQVIEMQARMYQQGMRYHEVQEYLIPILYPTPEEEEDT